MVGVTVESSKVAVATGSDNTLDRVKNIFGDAEVLE